MFKLSESVLGSTLKREQELSMPHLSNFTDVKAVLPTEFGKSLTFQVFVMMCRVRNRPVEYHRDFSIFKDSYAIK